MIPKKVLLNTVWDDATVTENSLARAIALLRRLLGDDARSPRFIETLTTVGYRFVCPVEAVEDTATVARAPQTAPATSHTRRKVGKWVLAGEIAASMCMPGPDYTQSGILDVSPANRKLRLSKRRFVKVLVGYKSVH